MNYNLEEGFEQQDDEIEISKYGKRHKEKKKRYRIIFILVIVLLIVFFITNVYLFYLLNITKAQYKYIAADLKKSNLEKKSIKINLMNTEKKLQELTEKYKSIEEKNYGLTIDNINSTANLNKKIIDLEGENQNLKKKNEKVSLLEEENKNLLNQQKEKTEINNKLNDELKQSNDYLQKIKNEYLFLSRDKRDKKPFIIKNEIKDENISQDVIKIASEAIYLNNDPGGITYFIKNEFDRKYNPSWECIIGYDLAYSITYEIEKYVLFYIGQYKVLLYKSPKS